MHVDLPSGIEGVDLFETIRYDNLKWNKFGDAGNIHKSTLKFPLLLDENKLKRTSGGVNLAAGLINLVPSFQTCLLGRFHQVRFEFEFLYGDGGAKFGVKDGKKVFVGLPLGVV
ncbi:unnamed protein product [Ambrosiozyma monospora]|uniref:Unnamed protein product n=1 Tax=Ambrosiozyma monospora TaxID=43982 RepID=A0ACB5ST22_AMBMO|nr:unnamed protein product [Ambrosiozyma monospora]